MKPLNHRDIFLRTLDGFFAPLVGAFKGAVAEIQRTSNVGRRLADLGRGEKSLSERRDANKHLPASKRRKVSPRRR